MESASRSKAKVLVWASCLASSSSSAGVFKIGIGGMRLLVSGQGLSEIEARGLRQLLVPAGKGTAVRQVEQEAAAAHAVHFGQVAEQGKILFGSDHGHAVALF